LFFLHARLNSKPRAESNPSQSGEISQAASRMPLELGHRRQDRGADGAAVRSNASPAHRHFALPWWPPGHLMNAMKLQKRRKEL
jgi:hypothetical protein